MSIKDDDIEKLFGRIAEHFKHADERSHQMFRMLVDTTLKFRDEIVKRTGVPLTIGETHKALDIFMEVLKTHKIPPNLDKNVHDLVVIWLEEIKTMLHH
jgi:hypothetical protein